MAPRKVFYKGTDNDFLVFAENSELLDKFRKGDTTIPLVNVVSVFTVYTSRTGGSEGLLDEASKSELSNEFGDKSIEEVIKTILLNGSDKARASAPFTYNSTNDSREGPVRS